MKKTFLLALFVSFSLGSFAQNFQWAKSIDGDYVFVRSIAVDASENLLTTGEFSGTVDFDPGAGVHNLTSQGNDDIFISKSDGSGNLIWVKSLGGIKMDRGSSITVDASGNVYTTGYFGSTVDFDPNAATYNLTSDRNLAIFILKLDASGNFIWARKFGGKLDYDNYGTAITVDASGNVYASGMFNGVADFDASTATFNLTSIGKEDIFILKLDSDGKLIWAKSMGGANYDSGSSIAVGSSGNVYVSGFFSGPVDFDSGSLSFILNPTSDGVRDIFISKVNASGDFVWAKSLGADDGHNSNSMHLDSDENVYTTGAFVNISDFDPGDGVFNLTSSGTFDSNVFMSKLDSAGTFVWAKSIGGTGIDRGESITVDASGMVYTTGSFTGTVDFDPGISENNLSAVGGDSGSDIFISKLNSSGDFEWAKSFGESYFDYGYSIAVNASGDVYAVGTYAGTVDFDPGAATFNLTSKKGGVPAGPSCFILKLVTTITDSEELTKENYFSVYPNPANDVIKIQTKASQKDVPFSIADKTGRKTLSGKLTGTSTLVDISQLSVGFYFVQVGEWHKELVKIIKN